MAENINFIPAPELPEATGEEVSVLCIENGEMKQKPGASIGGKELDMRIRYNFTDGTYGLIDGTYQQVVSKINNDVSPTIYCIKVYANSKSVIPSTATYFPDLNTLEVDSEGLIFTVSSDNSIVLAD